MADQFQITTKDRKFLPFDVPQEKEWTEPFYFIQAADTQLGMQATFVENNKQLGWDQEIEWTQQMIRDINAMTPKPKFLVICGDLLDAFPDRDPEKRAKQETDLKRALVSLEVPLVCVCGNHDVGNTPTLSTIRRYRGEFGDDYFGFWAGGVYFLVLNSQFFEDPSMVPELAEAQRAWLDDILNKISMENPKPKHIVIFQHIPFFLNNPNEAKEYFNIEIELRNELLSKFYNAGVRYIFTGHYHRNAGGKYRDLELVVTSAVGVQLGNDLNGYRIVKVNEDKLNHQYYGLGTAPNNISLH